MDTAYGCRGGIKGAKLADGQATLTDGNSILATGKPVISNVNVNQTEEMDGSKYIGIGFLEQLRMR